MRVGVTLSPTGDWTAILNAAQLADRAGLDTVGFWDHYHSEKPEWAYVCGWSAYGALASVTSRIRLLPMVICRLNYTTGVLAKETSVLSITSGGRFELGIGAGDYPVEYTAWHQPFPDAATRIEALAETIAALRELWQGKLVRYSGSHIQLTDAACTPVPPVPPRIVVGVGGSRRLIQSAISYADELNIYSDHELLTYVQAAIAQSGRSIDVSVFLHWQEWPQNLRDELARWAERGVARAVVNIGYNADLSQRVTQLAETWLR
jgi:alkanesulfonate monooxygenase SsuD/methylene tetrahydromethanopterin reductase-like flavin-dependent oxidoreductase (luciferase family)